MTVLIGENFTFYAQFTVDTLAITDATGDATYAIYEATTTTAILTGTMTKMTGTTGFYAGTIACTAANGFEHGKSYAARVSATVSAIAQAQLTHFKIDNGFAAKWLRNKVAHNLNTKTFTLYDDDGTTALATRVYSESQTSTGTQITFPALA